MAKIVIRRRKNIPEKRCFGELYTCDESGNRFMCNTLEDPVRPDGIKIAGQTAIPAGEYKVVIDYSEKFKKLMPHILDVPNFLGVRFHTGNREKDTEGCVLVGVYDGSDGLISSKTMFTLFMAWLEPHIKKDGFVTLLIEDAF